MDHYPALLFVGPCRDQINATEIVAAVPLELKRIIYTHFLLRLRAEKHFDLLAYMNASLSFRSYAMCDILPKIWNETKTQTTIKLTNGFYEAVSTPTDDFVVEMSLTVEKMGIGIKEAAADAFTRILYTFFSIGGSDSVVRLTPISENKTKLSVMSSDMTILALINIDKWVRNEISYVIKNSNRETVGLRVSDIDAVFSHTVTYPQINDNVPDDLPCDMPIDDDFVSVEDTSFDETEALLTDDPVVAKAPNEPHSDDSDSDDKPIHTFNPFTNKIPTYTFSKTYDKIVACGFDRYFVNAKSGQITHTECLITSEIPTPRTAFDAQIVTQVDHLIRLYEWCTKNNDVVIIRNNDENGFTMGNTHKRISFEGAYNEPLGDFHVKISSEWIRHILPMMNIIVGCSFFVKHDFPIVVKLLVRYSRHSDSLSNMFVFVCPMPGSN